jgi:hypothetical protein
MFTKDFQIRHYRGRLQRGWADHICSSTGDENTEEEKLDLTTTLSEVAPPYRKLVSKIIRDYNNLFANKNS